MCHYYITCISFQNASKPKSTVRAVFCSGKQELQNRWPRNGRLFFLSPLNVNIYTNAEQFHIYFPAPLPIIPASREVWPCHGACKPLGIYFRTRQCWVGCSLFFLSWVVKISQSLKYIGEKHLFLNEALKSNKNTLFTWKKKTKRQCSYNLSHQRNVN